MSWRISNDRLWPATWSRYRLCTFSRPRSQVRRRIATGEAQEEYDDEGKSKAAVELGRKGGAARAVKLTKKQRSEIARKAAQSRWRVSK